jgi:hypothetical protein
MIMIAVGALTVCHPGPLFFTEWTRVGLDSGYPDAEHTTVEVKPSKNVSVRFCGEGTVRRGCPARFGKE